MPPSGHCASRIQLSKDLKFSGHRASFLSRNKDGAARIWHATHRKQVSQVTDQRSGWLNRPPASADTFANSFGHVVRQGKSCGCGLAYVGRIRSLAVRRRNRGNSHPMFERQELPDLHRPIFGTSAMLVHKTPIASGRNKPRFRMFVSESRSSTISRKSCASQ